MLLEISPYVFMMDIHVSIKEQLKLWQKLNTGTTANVAVKKQSIEASKN